MHKEQQPNSYAEAFKGYINQTWDDYMDQAAGVEAESLLTLRELQKVGADIGITAIDYATDRADRQHMAANFAGKLLANPTRTMDITNIAHDNGILSAQQRGREPRSVFKAVQNAADRVSFTFGLPYVFNSFSSCLNANNQKPCFGVVVLDGEKMLENRDLRTPFVDLGILYRNYNPMSKMILTLPNKYTDFAPSPLQLVYEHVMEDPERFETFDNHMQEVVSRHEVGAVRMEQYLGSFIMRSFPLMTEDKELARNWRNTYAPEGSVPGDIPVEDIRAVITSREDHAYASEVLGDFDIPVIDGGHSAFAAGLNSVGASYVHNNVNLTRAYFDYIGADETDAYSDFLVSGAMASHSYSTKR